MKTNPYLSVVAREYNILPTRNFLLWFPDASQDEVKKTLLEEEKQAVMSWLAHLSYMKQDQLLSFLWG